MPPDKKENGTSLSDRISWLLNSPIGIASLMGIIFYATYVTNGTFNFLQGHILSFAYNYYFLSLIHGRLDLPPQGIGFEGFYDTYGRIYMYMGVLPAFYRVFFWPFVALDKVMVSNAVVFVLSVASAITAQVLLLRVAKAFPSKQEQRRAFWLNCACIGIWFCSPITFLATDSSMYHEPIISGLLLTLLYFSLVIDQFLIKGRVSWLGWLGLGLLSALAIHTRPHIGAAFTLGTGLFMLLEFYRRGRDKGFAHSFISCAVLFAGPLLIIALSGAAYMYMDYLRWGSPFAAAPLDRWGYYLKREPMLIPEVEAYKTMGRFNPRRFFPTLVYHFTGLIPLTRFFKQLFNSGPIRLEAPSDAILTFMWPLWIFILATVTASLAHRKGANAYSLKNAPPTLAPLAILGLVSAVIFYFISTFGIVTLRYKTELWPLFFFAAIVFFAYFDFFMRCWPAPASKNSKNIAIGVFALSLLFNAYLGLGVRGIYDTSLGYFTACFAEAPH